MCEGILTEAYVDVDGTIAGTLGECKGGMDISYKGVWGLRTFDREFGEHQ